MVDNVDEHSLHLHKFQENCNSVFAESYNPSCRMQGCWHLKICCAGNFRGCVIGRKNFNTAAKKLGRQVLGKLPKSSGSKKKVASKFIPTCKTI